MRRNPKRIWTSWALALMLLFSVLLPAQTVYAADKSTVLTEFVATLKQGGAILGASDKIDSEKDIQVEISFRVPVQGDQPTPTDPVNYLDTARFEVSDAFRLLSDTTPKVLKFGNIPVATLTLEESGSKVFANVVFDGDPTVFDGSDPSLNTVKCLFTANLKYDKTGDDGEEKDVNVAILEKTYTVHVPPAEIVYEVTKSGTPNLADRTITWNVDISATKAGNPVDLAGYKFVDNLNAVGEYIPGTFSPSSLTPVYDETGKILSGTFPTGSTSPQTVTFQTEIPENKYYGSGNQSITNTAQLMDGADVLKKDGTKSVTFTPPKWIEKTGTTNDKPNDPTYDPTNRTITWAIIANHEGAALNNIVITDALKDGLTFHSAIWEKWDSASSTWVEETSITPIGNEYRISNITSKIRLTIVTNVPNESHTTGKKTYTNAATISWTGSPDPATNSGLRSGVIGVDIGYSALTKTGTADPAARKVKWNITVDARSQSSLTGLKVYDLLVYGSSASGFDKAAANGWPLGINVDDITVRYDQAYISGTFQNIGPSVVAAPTVHDIMQGGKKVAELLEFTNLSNAQVNAFTFETRVLNPDLFASNTTNSKRIYNTAMLFSNTTKITETLADPVYNSSILRKEMLKREAMDNPAAGVNALMTLDASESFHYIDKSVIFRLSVNADGIDWTDLQNGDGEALGKAIVTDSLPTGWEFDKIDGKDFLIFEGVKNGTSVNATDTAPDTVSGLTANFSGTTATFTFDLLTRPYVILVKAKPNAATIQDYFGANHSGKTATNTVGLKTENWQPGVSTARDVSIASTILTKTDEKLGDGEVEWTVEYRPYELTHSDPRRVEDTLPIGLDLRTDATGKLLLDGNIAVNEMILQANGTYTMGDSVALVLGDNISYDNATRTLKFAIPENNKAYRLTYVTDVTGAVGQVTNAVKLISGSSNVGGTAKPYLITSQDGSATLQRNGWLEITKTDGAGALLPGAEFTIFAMDGATVIRQGMTGADGKVMLKVIPDGDYLLRETKAPAGGYTLEGATHTVGVKTEGSVVTTTIDGKTGTDSNKLAIKNFLSNTAGSLTIRKTVAGNATEPGRKFEFSITLDDMVNTYPYIGANGGPSGNITGSATIELEDGESVTITGVPKDTMYSVTEKDYTADGYVTAKTGDVGVIVADATAEAVFTNTRNAPGSLTISKTVMGNAAEEGKKFEFTITLSDTANTYTYTGANGGPSGTITGSATIGLAGGQSITIADLREGTIYQVTEKDYSGEGYTTAKAGDTGRIETKGTYVAAFTNTKSSSSGGPTGGLTISKRVAGNGASATKRFEFLVTFNAAGTYSYSGSGVSGGTIESGGRISLAHGQSVTIKGLPKGAVYTVTEADYIADGYIGTSTGETGVITGGMTKTAAFTNTFKTVTPGALMIRKTVVGDDYSKSEVFTFVVTFDANGRYPYSGSKTGTIASGESIRLSHGESVEIMGLPAETPYRVTEREANHNGYYTSATGATGNVSASGSIAAFVNTRMSVPKTGGDSGLGGKTGMAAFTVVLILLSAQMSLRTKRRPNRK